MGANSFKPTMAEEESRIKNTTVLACKTLGAVVYIVLYVIALVTILQGPVDSVLRNETIRRQEMKVVKGKTMKSFKTKYVRR